MHVGWSRNIERVRYDNRHLERMRPGIDLLLDAFAIVDLGVEEALTQSGKMPACSQGCFYCCLQPIPVTPLEILALRLFVEHCLPEEGRSALEAKWAAFQGGSEGLNTPCPFLHDGQCAVYPVRPIACRQYVVFGSPCVEGEDPTKNRPQQMLAPNYDCMHAALKRTLPWYRERYTFPEHVPRKEVQSFFRSVTTVIQAVPWGKYSRP